MATKAAARWTAARPLNLANQAPGGPGLYRIFRGGSQVYMGKAKSLRSRLLQHRWCLTHFDVKKQSLGQYTYSVAEMPGSTDRRRTRVERGRIDWHKKRGRLTHQKELDIGASEAEAFLPSPAQAAWAFWKRQLEIVARAFREQRYGCWCGPGNVCSQTQDVLDLCCKAHDNAYAAVGVTSGSSGGISMWSVEGLKRTEAADSALVACAARAMTNPSLGPAAHAYARGVMSIFGTRAQAARVARFLGL
jgi:hypothetical protein